MDARSKHISDFHIAGMRFWDGALVLDNLKPGSTLTLVAEPDNPHDANAVAIYHGESKLGYVPREKNSPLSQLLYFGHESVLECRVLKVDAEAEPHEQVRAGIYVTDRRGA